MVSSTWCGRRPAWCPVMPGPISCRAARTSRPTGSRSSAATTTPRPSSAPVRTINKKLKNWAEKGGEVPGAIPGPCFMCVLACLLLLCAGVARAAPADEAFGLQLAALATGGFPEKSAAVTALTELRHPHTRAVLGALLDGKLYYRNADNREFITDRGEARLALTDPLTLK